MSLKIQVEDRTLTVEDTQGMFLILGTGFLTALLALTLELLTKFLKNRKTIDANESTDISLTPISRIDDWIIRKNSVSRIRFRSNRSV
jgi:hypothetical protein